VKCEHDWRQVWQTAQNYIEGSGQQLVAIPCDGIYFCTKCLIQNHQLGEEE